MRSPFAILCSLTVAASAALIVLLAPMVLQMAPPLPGGARLLYQIALLAGAVYAHFLGYLPLRAQGPLHAALGAAALLTLPLTGGAVALAVLESSRVNEFAFWNGLEARVGRMLTRRPAVPQASMPAPVAEKQIEPAQ